jgi:photosystem II stability/assembly factor-like uncharacterized protein
MALNVEVYAGTAGHSAWFSNDLGATWVHPNSHSGMYLEARVWAFSSHPRNPDILYAGTDMGLFRWDERTTRWTHLPSPMTDIWALVQDPDDADVIFAGTRPAGFYRSRDAGLTWEHLSAPGIQQFSEINMGPTRVTQMLFDPVDHDTIWAVVEIGGVYRSSDRGNTWELKTEGLVSADMHGIAIIHDSAGHKILYATTNRGLHRSTNNGETWSFITLDSPWQYVRGIVVRPDSDAVLFLTNGNGPPGSTGTLWRSKDYGLTWHALELPGLLNSTPWSVVTHPHDPMLLWTYTNLGQVYRSHDGGDHWVRLPHEFGELRAMHWRPTHYPADRPAHSITVRPPVVAAA